MIDLDNEMKQSIIKFCKKATEATEELERQLNKFDGDPEITEAFFIEINAIKNLSLLLHKMFI